ncbi:hypothetical protein HPB50_027945 [Hyalomma asiaticum]|nr:hypothetical protein HPB50_027945 [Hyalomma asiaticum]
MCSQVPSFRHSTRRVAAVSLRFLEASRVQHVRDPCIMAGVGKRLIPLLDRILVERFVPEARTKGGIMIPEKAQAKVHSATVVAVGPEDARREFYIFRDSDVLGKWPTEDRCQLLPPAPVHSVVS